MIDRFIKIISFSPCTVKVPAFNPVLTVFYLALEVLARLLGNCKFDKTNPTKGPLTVLGFSRTLNLSHVIHQWMEENHFKPLRWFG